ncbi:MAG: 7-carboxy-7-deazaguanine synthase QueE [Gammaproteobacteria bacterium]|nr:7-carboxy-7-deazaguanine synthase QueE [Gammaproteobacteria bacterium]
MVSSGKAEATATDRLRITEIFYSLQGEARSVGWPTVFIRLTGCPLRCGYCDTSYAFQGGEWVTFDEILHEVARYNTRHVTVTGGEPLAQKPCLSLLTRLCDAGYQVSLETSGALDVSAVDSRVVKVMDIKTPASGEVDKNLESNLQYLTTQDQVKFVLCDRQDYDWAVALIQQHALADKSEVLFSPVHGQLDARQLADWILADQLPVRFQIQLHKLLWGDEAGR